MKVWAEKDINWHMGGGGEGWYRGVGRGKGDKYMNWKAGKGKKGE